jgi:uroporphyrinogen-III synthase
MSLHNLTVGITSSRRAAELAHIVKSFGGIPYIAPTVGLVDAGTNTIETKYILETVVSTAVDYFIFMTGPSIHYLFKIAEALGLKNALVRCICNSTVISRSHKPSAVLHAYGIQTDLMPEDNTMKGIIDILKTKKISKKRVVVVGSACSNKSLKNEKELREATVVELPLFRYSSLLDKTADNILKDMGYRHQKPEIGSILKLINDLIQGDVQVITFTSPPSVLGLMHVGTIENNLPRLRNALNEGVIVVSVGPSTTETLEQNGINVDVVPKVFRIGPMISALTQYLSANMKTQDTPAKLKTAFEHIKLRSNNQVT